MKYGVTEKQLELFNFIKNYINKNTISPSFEEMKRTRAYFKFTLRQCREDVDRVKSDILAKKIYHVDDEFHARYSAIDRTYRYVI